MQSSHLDYRDAQMLLDGYIMVGIDGVEIGDGSDWFCYHASSYAILPVGYCQDNNIPLTVPTGNVLKNNFPSVNESIIAV